MDSGTLLAIVLGLVALLVSVGVFLGFATVRRRILLLQGSSSQEDILEAVTRQVQEVQGLRTDVRAVAADIQTLAQAFQGSIQRFAVFRYDAFEDMGGQLSFSAALLNDHGDGVVISCINGRQEARTYAKPVHQTQSEFNLSPEERMAIDRAMQPA